MKVAIAAFVALGGNDHVPKDRVREQQEVEAMGISMDVETRNISYSPAYFYIANGSRWQQIADFSKLKPVFVPVRIKINAEHHAVVHETYTVVDGEQIPNEAILRVAAQIKANENR